MPGCASACHVLPWWDQHPAQFYKPYILPLFPSAFCFLLSSSFPLCYLTTRSKDFSSIYLQAAAGDVLPYAVVLPVPPAARGGDCRRVHLRFWHLHPWLPQAQGHLALGTLPSLVMPTLHTRIERFLSFSEVLGCVVRCLLHSRRHFGTWGTLYTN